MRTTALSALLLAGGALLAGEAAAQVLPIGQHCERRAPGSLLDARVAGAGGPVSCVAVTPGFEVQIDNYTHNGVMFVYQYSSLVQCAWLQPSSPHYQAHCP